MSERGLLGRLLGPAGPEVTCDECFERLDACVDGELAGRDADAVVPGMRAHLEGCPACAADHDSLLALAGEELLRPPGDRG
jgi:anti-sigma factor RsiW